jgi:hypothetical protein
MAEANRTKESRHSRGDGAQPGTVLAAFVRARLLGMQILTLDARVVIAPADTPNIASAASRVHVVAPVAERAPTHRVGQRGDLAYAVRLLQDGAKSLEEVRSPSGLS